jgi:UPF0755 protein
MSGKTPTDPADEPQAKPDPSTGLLGRRHLRTPREALQPDDAPAPPKPKKKIRRRPALAAVSGFLSFLLIIAVGGMGLFSWSQQQMQAPGPLKGDRVVIIAPRTEVYEIIGQLEREGVIDSGLLLNAALLAEGNRSKVKAGEYLFKQSASLREVIDTLVSGREILHSITIPEGLTSEQILQRLRDHELLTGELREIPKEGTLLPETYRIARGMSRSDLIRKMQDDQKRVLEQIWARRASDIPLRSPYELLTLASIVEKETGKADERPRVAGVFINRLTKRMRLQSDPTIVYGIVGGKGTLGRGILRSEVDRPTPYNTYQIEGLPPGPIANPGRAALEAVANPSRTKDLFFVADGTGGHVFAESLEQHNRNVARWRQIERDIKAQPNGPAPVDKFQPDAPAVGRDQRGEAPAISVPVFGALSQTLVASTPEAEASEPKPAVAAPSAPPRSAPPVLMASPAPQAPSPPPNGKFGLDSKLDKSLGANFPAPRNVMDGPMDGRRDDVDTGAYPVNAERRSQQRSQSARYGMPAGADELPSSQDDLLRPSIVPGEGGPKVVRIYDASEGTSLDPLKNKTWDLNSPKTVPAIKPEDSADKPAARKAKPTAAQPAPKPTVKVAEQPAQAAPKPRQKPAHKPVEADDENATN